MNEAGQQSGKDELAFSPKDLSSVPDHSALSGEGWADDGDRVMAEPPWEARSHQITRTAWSSPQHPLGTLILTISSMGSRNKSLVLFQATICQLIVTLVEDKMLFIFKMYLIFKGSSSRAAAPRTAQGKNKKSSLNKGGEQEN